MTSNENKNSDQLTIKSHENRTDLSSEMIVKAINYPPGYPECNKKEEKHKDCHPMHCHHMQPMLSATNALFINNQQQDSKK